MNKEMFEGNWNKLKGKAKEKWGKLTDNDLMRINGKKEQLIGELQKKYGYIKAKAEEEVANWEKTCGCDTEPSQEYRSQTFGNENQSRMNKQQRKMKQKH